MDKKIRTNLNKLASLHKFQLTENIVLAAEQFDKIISEKKEGVLLSPCGSGKSLFSIAKIASDCAKNDYIYVVESRDMVLAKKNELLALDIYAKHWLGWNSNECLKLSGVNRSYKDCLRNSRSSACLKCLKKSACNFANSDLDSSVLLMTMSGFVTLVESGKCFEDKVIIIDEDLKNLASLELDLTILEEMKFVFSGAKNFKVKNYIENLMSYLQVDSKDCIHYLESSVLYDREIANQIRRYLNSNKSNLRAKAIEQQIYALLFFLRTSNYSNSSVAVLSNRDKVYMKKKRINLKIFTNYKKLFIFNASAFDAVIK